MRNGRTQPDRPAGAPERPNQSAGAMNDGPLAPQVAQRARQAIIGAGLNMQEAVAELRGAGRTDAEIRQILPETNPEMFPRR